MLTDALVEDVAKTMEMAGGLALEPIPQPRN